MLVLALSSHDIDNAIFKIAAVLEIPVLVLALIALATIIFELGTFAVEIGSRWGHRSDLEVATANTRRALLSNDEPQARRVAAGLARSAPMARALSTIVSYARIPGGDHRLSKALADFDYQSQSRLARTRLLVRAGPALGLMGTLIPLSPALTGLAEGNVSRLSTNLRIAFSVTVLGLLVGAVAFGLSIYRDRMYEQDLSDLEYVAAVVSDPRDIPFVTPPPLATASAEHPTTPVAPAAPQPSGSPVPAGAGSPPAGTTGSPTVPAGAGSSPAGATGSPLSPPVGGQAPDAAAPSARRPWRQRLIRRTGGSGQ